MSILTPQPRFTLATCVVRPWRANDLDALLRHANNRRVSENLRDRFPYPYTSDDARTYLTAVLAEFPTLNFAVEVDGEASGGIGLVIHDDIERLSAEIGYWLGESHWGRGIMPEALRAVTRYALNDLHLVRIYAVAFARNQRSVRVLEKAGYRREGIMRRAVVKNGEIIDQFLYSYIDKDLESEANGPQR